MGHDPQTNVATECTPLVGKGRDECCSVAFRVRLVTAIASLAEGYDIGVVSGAVVLFREELHLANWQVGLSLGAFPACVAISAPLAGQLADKIGRKGAMIVACVLLTVGALLMAFAPGFEMLLLGRMVAGSGTGTGLTAVTAYMSEVAPSQERGFYGSLEELFVNIGNVVGYLANFTLLGVPNDWRWMLGLGAVPAFLVLVTLLLPESFTGVPESPRWLAQAGKLEEARAVLMVLLHGDKREVDEAFEAWSEEARLEGDIPDWPTTLEAFLGSRRRMALAGVGCGALNNFTGIQLMMVTTTLLLTGAGMEKRQAMWTTIWLGVIKAAVMLFVALFVLDRWGRRPLLCTSAMVCAGAAIVGGVGAHMAFASWDWLEICGLCLFMTGYSLGLGPVPWVYMPEVLESRFRAKGCALGISLSRCSGATHIFLFPIVFPLVGAFGMFSFLLVVNLIALAYVAAFCPETKQKSLEQIQEIFNSPHEGKTV